MRIMFGFLKKKLDAFVEKIAGKPEEKKEELPVASLEEEKEVETIPVAAPIDAPVAIPTEKPVEKIPEVNVTEIEEKPVVVPEVKIEKPVALATTSRPKVVEVKKPEPQPKPVLVKPEVKKIERPPVATPQVKVEPVKQQVVQSKPVEVPKPEVKLKPREATAKPRVEEVKTRDLNEVTGKDEKKFEAKQGFFSKITNVFKSEVELKKEEVEPALDDLHMSLLEADVSFNTAEFIISHLRGDLVGKKVAPSELSNYVNNSIKTAILQILNQSKPDTQLLELIKISEKPFVVMFIGPNGAGKTTTIAKLSKLLTSQGLSCVISASDTFRAAAIQQSQHHGEKLGVKVIAHKYGADPTAVAFDSINHAKAHQVDVVLIDTAGRQDTNVNLLQEMEKINRVIKPNLKIFIGESLAGHALIEQVKTFTEKVNIDGLILTKLDCDPKGGNAISIAHETQTPIYYLGLGQEYTDLAPYEPEKLISKILAE